MKTILLVDDETRMLDLLALYLMPLGYNCVKKRSAIDAILYLESHPVDLILLDVMMPEMDGWTACKEIKKFRDIPIIMLTARSEKPDIVKGLKIGADDYILKPFDEEELLARIEAVLRRTQSEEGILSFKGLVLKPNSYELLFEDKEILLTPKEFAMMGLFLGNRNKVFSRDHFIVSVWGDRVSIEDRTIDSHVRNLRDKLRKVGFPADDHLQTVWGVGYKWTEKK
ncbi:MAG: response regulator transcription factor [Bacillota bacterium]|uniref:DNA-binding response regulator n=1 Tax=Cytobacillus oceanisediminis 2691 TaxID=1196031 RepID=A0A160MHP0_9BACI|nr:MULTISPECIES: response regulator transcription factor [Bacillaceae]AND42916.1 DNA-binding response regulator [Cytobacillus oceanisediminis 2691]MBN8202717.1 response regulator transcription factor [Bacillus sp. NTK034]MCM3244713.1 response regulator transcription factor [Cytobacillus oceanisediminis]USK47434.1 response regulator transcription factor [Cytobacillus oceanisediminis]